MITVKQVVITELSAGADGSIDFGIANPIVVLPIHLKKIIAIGINPYFEISGVVEVLNSNDNYLGSISLTDNEGVMISEFLCEGSYYQNVKINQLLRKVNTTVKGGDLIKVIPQFSKEIIQKLSSKIPKPFQPHMYGITRLFIDVYIKYE